MKSKTEKKDESKKLIFCFQQLKSDELLKSNDSNVKQNEQPKHKRETIPAFLFFGISYLWEQFVKSYVYEFNFRIILYRVIQSNSFESLSIQERSSTQPNVLSEGTKTYIN
jgi:hypothetical protein